MNYNSHEIKIHQWIKSLSKSGCTINNIKTIKEIRKKNNELLFSLLDTDVVSPDGNRLPNIVFIRGHACVIVTLLKNRDTHEEKFLMIRQWRIGNGHYSLEFPAGMLDEHVDDPVGVAIRELEEETGLKASRDEIFALTENILYSSAGASDEGIYYYGCIKELDSEAFSSFDKRSGGNPGEHEHITVELLSRKEAEPATTSLQARLGFFLFEQKMNEFNL